MPEHLPCRVRAHAADLATLPGTAEPHRLANLRARLHVHLAIHQHDHAVVDQPAVETELKAALPGRAEPYRLVNLQARLHAHLAIHQHDHAVVDQPAVETELKAALAAAGHPAGQG